MEIAFETMFSIVMMVFFVGLLGGIAIGAVVKSKRNLEEFDYAPEFSWLLVLERIKSWINYRKGVLKSWLFLHGIYVKAKIKTISENEIE